MKPGTPNFALEKEAEKTVHFVPARSLQESEVCLWENILPFFFPSSCAASSFRPANQQHESVSS
jgi:hypothetical protein